MGLNPIGRAAVLALAVAVATGCAGRPPAPAEPAASGEPGPPPATPVVPVQSQPLGEPGS